MDFAQGEMSFFDTILARIIADGSLNRFMDAHGKKIDRLKQLGFYVDLDDKKRVRNTPAAITRETAQGRLDFARDVLSALRAEM